MKTRGKVICFAITSMVMLSLHASPARAANDDLFDDSYLNRLSALEAEVAALHNDRNQFHNASFSMGGSGDGSCNGGSCNDGCCLSDCCGRQRTLYVGGELTVLQVQECGITIPTNPPVMSPQFDHEAGFRVWAGKEFCDGLGFRVTYFDFEDNTSAPIAPGLDFGLGVDVYTVDLELTQRGSFCSWDFLMSGGVRIGGMEQSAFVTDGTNTVDIARDFDGAGLTIALAFERSTCVCGLDIYGGFRGSLMYGDADVDLNIDLLDALDLDPIVASVPLHDQTYMVWEIQMGVEYNRCTCYGNVFARAGVEAQVWEVPPIILGLGDDNVGFFGPTFALGLER